MRIAVISGDGVPVSGLLTIFRNVVDLGRQEGLLDSGPVPAELGYSWRPDKPGYYPDGPPEPEGREFLTPLEVPPPAVSGPAPGAAAWTAVRQAVVKADKLSESERADLGRRIDEMAGPYEEYFLNWLQAAEADWVIAVNMTLSDAVPVTKALHRAAARYYAPRGGGGVLFWDHDLFASCAVYEGDGLRMYPERPNDLTPVPLDEPFHRWAVVSEPLARESREYPTRAQPHVVPNVLPRVPTGPLEARHHEFLAQQGIAPGRPIVLNPVRVFRVKGSEIALDVVAGARRPGSDADPVLLVFGGLTEDPDYASEVSAKAEKLGLQEGLRFLGGVPLRSHQDPQGRWHLDEVDLLRLAAASRGAVVFTPNLRDVETVGLGPALAAVAGIPCAVTEYDAFEPAYGEDFWAVRVGSSPEQAQQAGRELLAAAGSGSPEVTDRLERNRRIVEERFPTGPWSALLRELAEAARIGLP